MAQGEERAPEEVAPPALEPPPAQVTETPAGTPDIAAQTPTGATTGPAGPASTDAPVAEAAVPGEVLAEIRQSKEMRSRRARRLTPLHRMDAIRGIPLGDLILGICGAMMALGVLGEWVSVVVEGRQTSYTGLELALRLGHLETLLVLATGLLLILAPLTRSGTVVPVIRARQAATFLVGATIALMIFELGFAYPILAAAYGPVEGLFPSYIWDMGPGFWLSLLGASLGLVALRVFRRKADEPRTAGGNPETGAGAVASAPVVGR
jgi:hypothetical protein